MISEIEVDGRNHSDPLKIAQIFNDYFIETTNAASSHATNGLSYDSCPSSLFLTPTSADEILRIIKSLSNSKSVGYDELPTWLLKRCATSVAPVISHIVNLSFADGVFPERLKSSIVKPLHKKGNIKNVDNYRPVTLIPILSKIVEKAMLKRMLDFMNKFDILRPEQNGFRKKKSTTLAIYKLVKSVIEGITNGDHPVALFFDMSKAFDFVHHKRLLSKLYKYGVRGTAFDWFSSYLNNRHQCTEISSMCNKSHKISFRSDFKVNQYGVPQGSILGPVLFLLYINDLPSCTPYESILFADDTTIIIKCKDKQKLEEEVNNTIENVIDWLNKNNLRVNLLKTKMMQFHTYNSTTQLLRAKYKSDIIEEVESAKFLGIEIDNMCNWKIHINTICLKLNRFVFALKRIRQVVSTEAALLAYHGYVASVLQYGLIIWGNSTDSDRAFRAQKKCIRAICGAHYLEPCRPLFKNLKLLTVPSMYIKHLILFVKQHSELFTKHEETRHRQLRNKINIRLFLPVCKLSLQKNAHFMAIKVFNNIPEDLKDLTFNVFKFRLHKWLIDKCFYSVHEFFNWKKM